MLLHQTGLLRHKHPVYRWQSTVAGYEDRASCSEAAISKNLCGELKETLRTPIELRCGDFILESRDGDQLRSGPG